MCHQSTSLAAAIKTLDHVHENDNVATDKRYCRTFDVRCRTSSVAPEPQIDADRGYVTDALADALTEAGFACHVLGDSKQCGNLRDAIEAGYKAACEL